MDPRLSDAYFQLQTSHISEFLTLAQRVPESLTNINILSK